MKRIIYTVLAAIIITSCYDDKGSYDYHDINEVTIDGLAAKYQVMTGVSTLKIEPKITTTLGDESNLEYEWRAVVGYTSSELIGTERNLEFPVTLAPTSYTLYLRVIDKTTGVTAVKTAALEVGTPYTKGLMMIGQDGLGKTKVQMLSISTDTILIKDVLGNTDVPNLSEGVDIIHTGKGSYSKLWLITKDEVYALDMTTMKLDPTKTFQKALFLANEYNLNFVPVDFAPRIKDQAGNPSSAYYSATICSNGYVFNSSTLLMGGAYFTDPVNRLEKEPNVWFKANPCMMYSLTNWGGFVYYDETNERFLKVASFTDYSTLLTDSGTDPFPWNQQSVGRTFVYGENTLNTDGGSTYGNSFAIMKNKSDQTHYIYKFYSTSTAIKRDFLTISAIATDFDKASFYAFSSRRTIIYYAVGSKLYAYDYNKGYEKIYLLEDYGDAQITMLKCDTQIEPSTNPIYVATYSSANGGTLQKYKQGTNPDVVTITADPASHWTDLIKIKKISWRATN